MSKIDEIKAAQLVARKARDTDRAVLLTTLIGEAAMVGKSAGNRTSTDEEVIQTLKKFEKNINENIRIFTERKMLAECDIATYELEIISEFLPSKLTDGDVALDIARIISAKELPLEQKSLGSIVKELKVKYGDQFDGQQVSKLFKLMLK